MCHNHRAHTFSPPHTHTHHTFHTQGNIYYYLSWYFKHKERALAGAVCILWRRLFFLAFAFWLLRRNRMEKSEEKSTENVHISKYK